MSSLARASEAPRLLRLRVRRVRMNPPAAQRVSQDMCGTVQFPWQRRKKVSVSKYQTELDDCLAQAAELLGGPAQPVWLEWELEKSLLELATLEARRGLGRQAPLFTLGGKGDSHQIWRRWRVTGYLVYPNLVAVTFSPFPQLTLWRLTLQRQSPITEPEKVAAGIECCTARLRASNKTMPRSRPTPLPQAGEGSCVTAS